MDIKFPNIISQNRKNNMKSKYELNKFLSLSPKKISKNSSNINSILNFSNISQNARNRFSNKNLGGSFELTGTFLRKSYNEIKKSTKGNWENLLNKSFEIIRPSVKRSEKRDNYESLVCRSLPSSMNNSFECTFGRALKIKTDYPEVKKSIALGSISDFISLIPTVEIKTKKLFDKNLFHHTPIFSNDFRLNSLQERRMKQDVNLNKIRNDDKVAGIPSTNRNCFAQNNYILNINRLKNNSYSKRYSQGSTSPPIKFAKKISHNVNTSTIFITNSTSTKHSSKKTYYNNDNYRKFFISNFGN